MDPDFEEHYLRKEENEILNVHREQRKARHIQENARQMQIEEYQRQLKLAQDPYCEIRETNRKSKERKQVLSSKQKMLNDFIKSSPQANSTIKMRNSSNKKDKTGTTQGKESPKKMQTSSETGGVRGVVEVKKIKQKMTKSALLRFQSNHIVQY